MYRAIVEQRTADQLVIPESSPRRKFWHTLPGRNEHFPIDRSLVGQTVHFNRAIVRCGYLFEYRDVSGYEIMKSMQEIAYQKLREILPGNLDDGQIRTIHSRMEREFGSENVNRVPKFEARWKWLQDIYRLPEYKPYINVRTFWYVDVTAINLHKERGEAKILGIKQHVIGVRYAASGGYSEDDYEPAGLEDEVHQWVYTVEGCLSNTYEDYYEGRFELHPLDVIL